MVTKFPMTPQGHRALQEELGQLKRVERAQIVKEIEVARAHGDLKENAEYHAAKEKQGLIESRIRDLESKLSHAEVINPADLEGDRVLFGARVTYEDLETGEASTYQIVGREEADLVQGKISNESPIAQALLGREIGDECLIRAPKGDRRVEIVEVVFE